jgi:hypothetical protein
VVLAANPLAWILGGLDIYIDDVPHAELPVMSEIPKGATLQTVHPGHHRGLDGLLFVTSAVLPRRLVRCDLTCRTASNLLGYFRLMASYGLLDLAEDGWREQTVKRGWTDPELPDFLMPEFSVGWAIILIGALIAWYLLLRSRES